MTILDLEVPTEVEEADHKLRDLPQAENTSVTDRPADPEAARVIAGITTKIPDRSYPINVHLPAGELPQAGTIMCAQILTISKDRLQRHRGRIDAAMQLQVDAALKVALGLPK